MDKRIFFVALFLVWVTVGNSQIVDAQYLNPKHISSGNYKFMRFGDSTNFYAGLMWNEGNLSYGNGNDFTIFTYSDRDLVLRSGYGNVIVFPTSASGNMGIGINSPDSKLHIFIPAGTSGYPSNVSKGDVVQSIRSNNNGIEIGNARSTNDRKAWMLARHSSVADYGKYYSSFHLQPDVGDKSQYRGVAIGYNASTAIPVGTHLAINGDVGIGTLNPDSKLTVKGNIHAQEVKVDLSVPGPDYVFKENYDLKPLAEVQDYIIKNGHLPNIPSAKEMEENGIELGEMNMKLLEKIEELTLYVIELKKGQTQLEKQNSALQDKLEKLTKK